MLPFTDTRAFSRSYVPGTGTARPCSVTSLASGPWSPGCTSSRTRIEPMLQNINCASPVAASTPTRTLGRSARTSWPCETFASSNRSRSLNDCDCAVMRASIRHLLLNVVVRAAGSESSLTGGSREQGAGSRKQGAGSREQYATLRSERGTLYGWASRRPTSHADSTASHPSAADPHRQRSEPRPLGRRQIAWATRVLRAARVRRGLGARAGAHGASRCHRARRGARRRASPRSEPHPPRRFLDRVEHADSPARALPSRSSGPSHRAALRRVGAGAPAARRRRATGQAGPLRARQGRARWRVTSGPRGRRDGPVLDAWTRA